VYQDSKKTLKHAAWRKIFIEEPQSKIDSLLKEGCISKESVLELIANLIYVTSEINASSMVSLYEGKNDAGTLISKFIRRESVILNLRYNLGLTGIGGVLASDVCKLFILNLFKSEFALASETGSSAWNFIDESKELKRCDYTNDLVFQGGNLNNSSTNNTAYENSNTCNLCVCIWVIMKYGLTSESRVIINNFHCGPYQKLITNWDNPSKISCAIETACDYHYKFLSSTNISTEQDHEWGFLNRPYNVIPFEILAYRSVRRKMGLETPWPLHPLLDSPFVKNLPDDLPPSDDPLLNEVLAAVRKVLPDV
jgi:hypothetical protein